MLLIFSEAVIGQDTRLNSGFTIPQFHRESGDLLASEVKDGMTIK
jgi:hypothetical protein